MSIQNIPPPLDKTIISTSGTDVKITGAAIKSHIQTSQGVINTALVLDCQVDGNDQTYGYLFSLDKEPVVGSAGRVASRTGAKTVDQLRELCKKLIGTKIKVVNKNGKLYWY